MSQGSSEKSRPFSQARATLGERLRARFAELEEETLTRVYAVSQPIETSDPEYVVGLRSTISAALEYGLAAIEQGEARTLSAPPALLSQARLAARNDIALDTVLRRYFVGYTLLGDFIAQEARRDDQLTIDEVGHLVRDEAAVFDRLIQAITQEYTREAAERATSTEGRRTDRVRRLLAGELLDTSEFLYEFDAWHIGALAKGPSAQTAIRGLAAILDCGFLLVTDHGGIIWAWFGRRHKFKSAAFARIASSTWPEQVSLAIGEPGYGRAGWRLSHQQARAVLPLAEEHQKNIVRYCDDALLASILQDELLVASLSQLYLVPLAEERDGGEILRSTLRTYFAAKGNVSATAATLKVSRKTVTNRLTKVEIRLDRPLDSCAAELEGALRLYERNHSKSPASRDLSRYDPLRLHIATMPGRTR